MEQVLGDDEARARAVSAAREHVLQFGWDEVARQTREVYERLPTRTPSRT